MSFVEFLVLALAVYRLARLVIEDTITEPLRTWILVRWPGTHVEYEVDDPVKGGVIWVGDKLYAAEPTPTGDKVAKLLSCYWCAAPWIAGPLVLAFWLWPVPVFWLAAVAAIAGLAGIIGILMAEAVE